MNCMVHVFLKEVPHETNDQQHVFFKKDDVSYICGCSEQASTRDFRALLMRQIALFEYE